MVTKLQHKTVNHLELLISLDRTQPKEHMNKSCNVYHFENRKYLHTRIFFANFFIRNLNYLPIDLQFGIN